MSPVHPTHPAPRTSLGEAVRALKIAARALLPWLLWQLPVYAFLDLPPRLAVVWLIGIAAFFLWCYAAPYGWGSARWRATSRARPVPGRAWPWLALLAPVMSTAALAMWMVLSALGIVGERSLPAPILEYGERPGGAVVLVLLIAGLVPMLEEFAFRGWLQRPLERRYGPGRAIACTALVFAVAHLEPRGIPIYAAGGLALGYAAWATGSIWSSVALHVAWNAGVLLFGGFFPGFDPAAHGRALALPAGVAFLACVGVFAWAAPRLRRAGRDHRRAEAT
ncbi:MAG TPA: type II CAAX endopeptidase family protein [Longimicrobium sp.]|nr:type II CAAX endopeptidase family protein [Longimicrobium sp.]